MSFAILVPQPARSRAIWETPGHSIDGVYPYGSLAPVGAYSSGTWPATDLAIYVPVRVKSSVLVRKIGYSSHTTATGNIDIGIYDRAGTRLVNSGSTVKSASNNLIYVDVTDTPLQPGLYYLALQASNNTDTFNRHAPAAPNAAAQGVRSQAVGSFGLPATTTWTVDQTLAYIPLLSMELGTVF